MDDDRFSAAASAPIFKKIKKDKHRIKLDERFSSVLSDDRFQLNPGMYFAASSISLVLSYHRR